MTGTQIKHYELIEEIGRGGMGTVYKARDNRLLRFIAIKLLENQVLKTEKNRRRFFDEARAASALNHPNICTIHDIGSFNDRYFIVMEYIQGETLAQLLVRRGPLPEDEAFGLCAQVCDALAATHSLGIIHRDIKPENIMVTEDGRIKIMDFGLAKFNNRHALPEQPGTGTGETSSEWLKASSSSLEGTVAYMAPEQVENSAIDTRTDVHATGAVLFELLTAHPPFTGADSLAIMTAILDSPPPKPSEHRAEISAAADAIVTKAMAKKPADRFQSMTAFAQVLRRALKPSARQTSSKASISLWLAGMLAALLLLALAVWISSSENAIRPGLEIQGLSLTVDADAWPVFSPDANSFAYISMLPDSQVSSIKIKHLGTNKTRTILRRSQELLAGLDWSPDGHTLAMFREKKGGIRVISTDKPHILKHLVDFGYSPRWSPDGGKLVFSSLSPAQVWAHNQIWLFNLSDSSLQRISPHDQRSYDSPSWSANQRWIACLAGVGSQKALWLLQPETGAAQQILDLEQGITNPLWSPDGRFIYFGAEIEAERGLYRVRIDQGSGTVLSPPELVLANSGLRAYSLSRDGSKLLYQFDENNEELWQMPLSAPDIWQQAQLLTSHTRFTPNIALSPDGSKLALETLIGNTRSLVLFDPQHGTQKTLNTGQPAFSPAWSSDGRWLLYDAGGGNDADIWRIAITGGTAEPVITSPGADWMPSCSPAGDAICFLSNRGGQFDLWIFSQQTGSSWRLTNTPAIESGGYWSNDGRKLAYFRQHSGANTSSLLIFDLDSNLETELLHFPDRRLDILTKIIWQADDSALYFHDQINLAKLDLASKTLSYPLGKEKPLFRYDLNGESLYIIMQGNRRGTLWMAEGL